MTHCYWSGKFASWIDSLLPTRALIWLSNKMCKTVTRGLPLERTLSLLLDVLLLVPRAVQLNALKPLSAAFRFLYCSSRRSRFPVIVCLPPISLSPSLSVSLSFPLSFFQSWILQLPGSSRQRSGAAHWLNGTGLVFLLCAALCALWNRREGVLFNTPARLIPSLSTLLCFFRFGASLKMTEEKRSGHVKLVGVWNPSPPRSEVSDSVYLCGGSGLWERSDKPGEKEAPGNRNGNRWCFSQPSMGFFFTRLCKLSLEWNRAIRARTCLR